MERADRAGAGQRGAARGRDAVAPAAPRPPIELDAEADALGRLVRRARHVHRPRRPVVGDSELTADELRSARESRRPPRSRQQARQLGPRHRARRYSATLDIDMLYVAVPVRNPARRCSRVRLALPLTEHRQQLAAVRRHALVALGVGLLAALALAWAASARSEPARSGHRGGCRALRGRRFHAAGRATTATTSSAPLRGSSTTRSAISRSRRRELEPDRARMEAILGGMIEGVLVVNEQGRLQLANDAARRMLKLARRRRGPPLPRDRPPSRRRAADRRGARAAATEGARADAAARIRRDDVHGARGAGPRAGRAAARFSCSTTSPTCAAPTRSAATSSPTSRTSCARR